MRGSRRNFRAGFTMMELLVAIGLVALLLTMINTVFNQTQQAISRGAATSELIGASRATSEQFTTDAKQMLLFENEIERLTEPPGFMVIIQDTRTGVAFPTPGQHNQPQSAWTLGSIRTDQIAFFRKADRLQSLTPGSNSRFDSDARAGMARVWYGHVYREPVIPAELPVTDMMLGRQALLIVDKDSPAYWPNAATPADSISANRTGGLNINHLIYATPLEQASGQLWNGATDVLIVDPTLIFDPTNSIYAAQVDADGQPNSAYKDSALSWAFPDPAARLIADPHVAMPAVDSATLTADVGQTHAAFIPYVSDFAIEFAADITDNLIFDPVTGTYAPGTDGLPDNTPDTYEHRTPTYDGAGNVNGSVAHGQAVKWYTTISPNEPDANGVPARPDEPVTWAIPSAGLHSGETSYPPLHGAGQLVFGHTGDESATPATPGDPGSVEGAGKWWPYMIRIRYRLHNRNGDFSSIDPVTGEAVSGKWFEQIIPIPR